MTALTQNERDEISLLLPWYANGTLDQEDSLRVEAALENDEALAREFDLVLEDQAAMIEVVSEEEVPASISERFKAALHSELEQSVAPATPVETGETFLSRIMSTLFPAQPRAYAAVAALIVILLPAVALVSFEAGNKQGGVYETASGDAPVTTDALRLLTQFNADARLADIDAFLKENKGQIVKGPTADGFYELEFEPTEGLSERMTAATDLFNFVLPGN